MSDKIEDMKTEREKMPYVKAWLEKTLNTEFRNTTEWEQRSGIDLIEKNTGKTFEIKIRGVQYRKYCKKDLYLETISDDRINSDGWIEYCQADYIIIVYEPLHDLIAQKWGMPRLKRWWKRNENTRVWKKKLVTQKEGHRTINRIIPLKFIDKWVQLEFLPPDPALINQNDLRSYC